LDLAADGKRVAVLTPAESTEAPKQEHEVVFLINFLDELRLSSFTHDEAVIICRTYHRNDLAPGIVTAAR